MKIKDIKKLPIARSCLYGTRLDAKQIDKPFVAIVYSQNEICPGHAHLDDLANAVRRGIESEGGTGIKINAGVGVCDGIAMGHEGMKYSLPSRELNRDAVVTMIRAHGVFDGVVYLGACDKNLPGYLLAAAELKDLPGIFVTAGAMFPPEKVCKKNINIMATYAAQSEKGAITKDQLEQYVIADCPTFGTCYGMFSANSLACVTEALGLTLPGMATTNAVTHEKYRLATASGRQIMQLIKEEKSISKVLSRESFLNAFTVMAAVGASTNTLLHLPAIAEQAGYNISLDEIDNIFTKTPTIVKLAPANQFSIIDFHNVGAIQLVMKRVRNLLHTEVNTVGLRLNKCLDLVDDDNSTDIIKTTKHPYLKSGGLAIYRGNIAPEGAVMKEGAIAASVQHEFVGTARVFNSEEEATTYIRSDELKPGDIIVIRYEGPAGGPGMREMLYPTGDIVGLKMDETVALITDGRFSGATSGICIGHVQPEAYNGGLIALLEDGDQIVIDRNKREINMLVSETELDKRRRSFVPVKKSVQASLLKTFRNMHTKSIKR